MRGGNQVGGFENPYINTALMEKNEEALKNYQEELEKEEELHRQKLSPSSRVANIAGDWVGGGIPMMGSPAGRGMKGIASMLGSDVATGGVSGALQETGLIPALSDLLALSRGKIAQGAQTMTEKMRRLTLPSAERISLREKDLLMKDRKTLGPLLQEVYEKQFGEPAHVDLEKAARNIDIKRHSDFLDPRHIPGEDETGGKVIDALRKKFNFYKESRAEKATPLYDLALQSGVKVDPSSFRSSIARLSLDKGEDTQRKLFKIMKMVKNNDLTPAKIQSINEDLNDMIGQAKVRGEDGLARTLTESKKMFDEEVFEKAPLLKKARSVYSEMSLPINNFENHPILKKVLAEGILDNHGYSEIIPPSIKSKRASQELLKELKNTPNEQTTRKSIIRQLYGDIFSKALSEENGKISLKKIKEWERENPGAKLIDPSLDKKLSNISNIKYFEKEAARRFLKQPMIDSIVENNLGYIGRISKKFSNFKKHYFSELTKLEKKLNKIPKERKLSTLEAMMNNREIAKFMLQPVEKSTKQLYENPLILANIERTINDLSK